MYIILKRAVNKLSIFQKMIIAFVLVILISGSISLIISKNAMTNIISKQIFEGNLSAMNLAAEGVNDFIRRAVSVTTGLSVDPALKKCLEIAKNVEPSNKMEVISNINDVNTILNNYTYTILTTDCNISIILPNGKIFANWETQNQQKVEAYMDRYYEYFSRFQQDIRKATVITKGIEKNQILTTSDSDLYVFTLIAPVKDISERNLLGIIVLSIPEDRIQKQVTLKDEHMTFIVDKDLKVVSSQDKSLIGTSFENISNSGVPNNEKGYYYTRKGNKDFIVSYLNIEQYDWKIVDIINSDYVSSEVNGVTNKQAFINIISMIALIVFSYLIALSITTPLKKLIKLMLKNKSDIFELSSQNFGRNEVRMLERSYFIMQKNIALLLEENRQKEKGKREAEIRALQSQIRPHFLFNTLNTIRWTALNNNVQKAADMVLALSNLLRMTLVKGEELITLKEEIASLEYYVKIIRMRHSTEFEMIYEIDEVLMGYKVPKLLLQPLVENSIIHGFENKKTGGLIKISGMITDDEVVLQITDNGNGFDEESLKKSKGALENLKFSGIGVDNVDKRIRLYFGEKYGLNLYKGIGEGTVAEIRLPKKAESEG